MIILVLLQAARFSQNRAWLCLNKHYNIGMFVAMQLYSTMCSLELSFPLESAYSDDVFAEVWARCRAGDVCVQATEFTLKWQSRTEAFLASSSANVNFEIDPALKLSASVRSKPFSTLSSNKIHAHSDDVDSDDEEKSFSIWRRS